MDRFYFKRILAFFMAVLLSFTFSFAEVRADEGHIEYTGDVFDWLFDFAKRNNTVALFKKTYDYGKQSGIQGDSFLDFLAGSVDGFIDQIKWNTTTGIQAIKNSFNSLSQDVQNNLLSLYNENKGIDIVIAPELSAELNLNLFTQAILNPQVMQIPENYGVGEEKSFESPVGSTYIRDVMSISEFSQFLLSKSYCHMPFGEMELSTELISKLITASSVSKYMYLVSYTVPRRAEDLTDEESYTIYFGIMSNRNIDFASYFYPKSGSGSDKNVTTYCYGCTLIDYNGDYSEPYAHGFFTVFDSSLTLKRLIEVNSMAKTGYFRKYNSYAVNPLNDLYVVAFSSYSSGGITPINYYRYGRSLMPITDIKVKQILIIPSANDLLSVKENLNNYYNNTEQFYDYSVINNYAGDTYLPAVNETTNNYYEYCSPNHYNETNNTTNNDYSKTIHEYITNNYYDETKYVYVTEIHNHITPTPTPTDAPPQPTYPPFNWEDMPPFEVNIDFTDINEALATISYNQGQIINSINGLQEPLAQVSYSVSSIGSTLSTNIVNLSDRISGNLDDVVKKQVEALVAIEAVKEQEKEVAIQTIKVLYLILFLIALFIALFLSFKIATVVYNHMVQVWF